jgi:hypothetical protein
LAAIRRASLRVKGSRIGPSRNKSWVLCDCDI